MTGLALVLLSGCGAATAKPPATPPPTAPSTAPAGAIAAVYFTVSAGGDAAAVAAAAMERPVYIERAPSGGANPGSGAAPVRPTVFLMPVAPGGEAAALARFKASGGVLSASLGRYPPILPA